MDLTKRVLIVGTEGCGKTTLIAQLTKKTATIKTTKLNENYQESQLSAKFKGHPRMLQLLETENEGVHFMAKASVIMVLFDSRSNKSQKDSTKIYNNICKTQQVTTANIPIILVFTKCPDDSATKEFERDPEFHLLSTNAKSGLGVDELKLKMFQLAYPEIDPMCSSEPELIERITHTLRSAMSTIKSMKFYNTADLEEESVAVSTIPFQLVKLQKYRSQSLNSAFSFEWSFTKLGYPSTCGI